MLTTVCFLQGGGDVLLGLKKKGFGQGRWNGIGGKFDSELDATIADTLVRETLEEIGVVLTSWEERGIIQFQYDGQPEWDQCMSIFVATAWRGTPQETDEILPQWFPAGQLPFQEMWEDDPHWLPRVLAGGRVNATARFDHDLRLAHFSHD